MHKLATTPITLECFEIDDIVSLYEVDADYDFYIEGTWCQGDDSDSFPLEFIDYLDDLRIKYLKTKDKRYWKELIRWLPESWLQTRTITMSYENLINICRQRQGHKLSEWHQFIDWVKTLPYAEELIFYSNKEKM